MITDAQLRPSQAQSLVGAAATTVSTNVIDLLSPATNVGRGRVRKAFVTATQTFAGGTSVQVQLLQSANADLSSPDVLATGNAVPVAQATSAGPPLMDIVIPDNTKRYIGFRYTTVGTMTAGAVSAYIVADTDRQPYLPSNTGF